MPKAPGGGSASQHASPTRRTFPKRAPSASPRIGGRRRGVEVRNEPQHDAGGRGAEHLRRPEAWHDARRRAERGLGRQAAQ